MHERLASQAVKAVNLGLTLRNWAIGFYLFEFEQKGRDRARYGHQLLEHVARRLQQEGLDRADVRELRRYRRLYLVYPHLRNVLPPEIKDKIPEPIRIVIVP